MRLRYLLTISLALAASFVGNSYAKDGAVDLSGGDDFIKNNIEEAKSKLGEIKNISKLSDDWLFVSGTEDSFMLTENGRFSIAAVNDKFVLKDLWLGNDITYSEYANLKDTYPVATIAQRVGASPFSITKTKDQKIGYSVFLIAGDQHSIDFFKENESKLAEEGAHLYILPGASTDLFYSIMCSSRIWQLEMLKGFGEMKAIDDSCDNAVVIHRGTQNVAITRLLKINDAPFVVRHKDWFGTIVNTKIFKVLTNE